MPVTNPDLLSPEPILYHPPNFEYAFKNPAFRAIDIVLSNMNNPNYIAKFYTDLEKLFQHCQVFRSFVVKELIHINKEIAWRKCINYRV